MSAKKNIDDEKWLTYNRSHFSHVALKPTSKLFEIEFRSNFGRHLPPTSARVLDFGFGQGRTLSVLSRMGYEDLHGWEISRDCVETAQQNKVPGELRYVDGLEALHEEEAERFDAIIAKDVLEHLDYEQVVRFTSGLYRTLKPGGVFLARLPNMSNPFATLIRYDDFTHRLGFTENSLRQVFTLGGFERDLVAVENDILPGWPLLKSGLVGAFVREKWLAPFVRWSLGIALHSQRKGKPKVRTLRIVIAARKSL